MRKKEKIFLAVVLLCAAVSWGGMKLFTSDAHTTIRITVDGEDHGTYSLNKDRIISIGDTNICEIKNGEAKMISATCPDHLCMKQNPIDEQGGTIVCLPNKVVIEGGNSASSEENPPEIDAVT